MRQNRKQTLYHFYHTRKKNRTRKKTQFGKHLKFESALSKQERTKKRFCIREEVLSGNTEKKYQHIEIPTLNMIDFIS